MNLYDKNGIPMAVGDTLKAFHFIGKRRKKYFMYKFIEGKDEQHNCFIVSHLSVDRSKTYNLRIDNSVLKDYEIVQGYGDLPKGGLSFEDRGRINQRGGLK